MSSHPFALRHTTKAGKASRAQTSYGALSPQHALEVLACFPAGSRCITLVDSFEIITEDTLRAMVAASRPVVAPEPAAPASVPSAPTEGSAEAPEAEDDADDRGFIDDAFDRGSQPDDEVEDALAERRARRREDRAEFYDGDPDACEETARIALAKLEQMRPTRVIDVEIGGTPPCEDDEADDERLILFHDQQRVGMIPQPECKIKLRRIHAHGDYALGIVGAIAVACINTIIDYNGLDFDPDEKDDVVDGIVSSIIDVVRRTGMEVSEHDIRVIVISIVGVEGC